MATPYCRPGRSSVALEPVEIDFPRSAVEDLHRRLDAVRWPRLPFAAGWEAGVEQGMLRQLVSHWREDHDWSAEQRELNRLDHLRGPVAGDELHCVRYRSGDGGFPVVVIHGWPGSFVEFLDAAELLRDEGFDVVVPSLPGFALSDPPSRPGLHGGEIAERLHLLMLELGYERYGVQGGDWGAYVGAALARRHPGAVAGLHLNLIPGASAPPPEGVEVSDEERDWRAFLRRFGEEETAYYDLQATKPHTLAHALSDSPVGLLAWIVEKFWAWSDHDADLWSTIDRDRLLTNVMLYWLPNAILSSARIYWEMEHADVPLVGGRVEVPTGYLQMPREPFLAPPREVAERHFEIVHHTSAPRGGHFAAMEQPELWAADVARFFRSVAGR